MKVSAFSRQLSCRVLRWDRQRGRASGESLSTPVRWVTPGSSEWNSFGLLRAHSSAWGTMSPPGKAISSAPP